MEKSAISPTTEEVKTDSLHLTSITTPVENKVEIRETEKTGTRTLMTKKLPLQKIMDNKKEEIYLSTHTLESEGKEKLCTCMRVMNETTLGIYGQKNPTLNLSHKTYLHQPFLQLCKPNPTP